MTAYNVGYLSAQVNTQFGQSVSQSNPVDTFTFHTPYEDQNMGLSLYGMDGDADLYLYEDSNGNGIWDASDALIAESRAGGTTDDTIEFSASWGGTYFAQVVQYDTSNPINYNLDLSVSYDVGALSETPTSHDYYYVSETDPTDIFEFSIDSEQTIHLNLNNIESGHDADINLYRDNGNGVFDSGDTLLASSRNSGSQDDLIDYRAEAGTYFAQVERYSSTDFETTYQIDMSATSGGGSNLVGGETNLDTLLVQESWDIYPTLDSAYLVSSSTQQVTGYLNDANTVDSYAFSVGDSMDVSLLLSGLSSDADIRLIQDHNDNGVVDYDEVIAISAELGSSSESINNIGAPGDYILQVYQYDAVDTGYTLDVTRTHYPTVDPYFV